MTRTELTADTSFEALLTEIDWARIAHPQTDQYDTKAVRRLAEAGPSPLRHEPYKRPQPDTGHAICDGAVAVRQAVTLALQPPIYKIAALDHPNLARAVDWLDSWPTIRVQFESLIDTVYPYTDSRLVAATAEELLGSSSHSFEPEFGKIHVTVDSSLGLAQAMVHEMAHHKLRALGLSFEWADRLITNSPQTLYESPIRRDRRRPMTAVFHAQYSFMHVSALNVEMFKAACDATTREWIVMLIKRNSIRMRAGYGEIQDNISTDEAGGRFVGEFMDWSTRVLEEAEEILQCEGYA